MQQTVKRGDETLEFCKIFTLPIILSLIFVHQTGSFLWYYIIYIRASGLWDCFAIRTDFYNIQLISVDYIYARHSICIHHVCITVFSSENILLCSL